MKTKSKEMRDTATFEREISTTLNEEVFRIAVLLAPGFRDKFDLSNPAKDFEQWADMAWQGAEAMLARKLKAKAQIQKDYDKAVNQADIQQLNEPSAAGTANAPIPFEVKS